MVALSTTRLSSKGQVVIPEEIRSRLGLKPGSRFVVVADGDTVIFKVVNAPDTSTLAPLLDRARSAARRAGARRADVGAAVRRARRGA